MIEIDNVAARLRSLLPATIRETVRRENLSRIYENPPYRRTAGRTTAMERAQLRAHRLELEPEDMHDPNLRESVKEIMSQAGKPATTLIDDVEAAA